MPPGLVSYNHKRSRPYNIDRDSKNERDSSSSPLNRPASGYGRRSASQQEDVSLRELERKRSAQEGVSSKETPGENLRKRG